MTASLALLPTRDLPVAHAQLLHDWLAAYVDHRLNLGHRQHSIDDDLACFRHFMRFAGPHFWTWQDDDMDRYGAHLRRSQKARSTLRRAQGAIKGICTFAVQSRTLSERCRALTGALIPQICHPWNTLRHQYGAATSKRRQLTDEEIAQLFAAIDTAIRRAPSRYVEQARLTHHAVFAAILATGAREHEAAMLDVADLATATTPSVKAYSRYEDVTIRFGKAHNGGPPRRRSVPAIYELRSFWNALAWYVTEVRPQVAHACEALFLTPTGTRYRGDHLSALFSKYRDAARLSTDLTLHCLRHTFATKLHEYGYELPVISHLLGHASDATTIIYDHLDADNLKLRVLLHNRQLRQVHR